jgi:hypothetical protein
MALDIEPGKQILCQELNTGKGYTGFFYLDEKQITADICSYHQRFSFLPDKPIFLRTEKNQIVSLHYNNWSDSGVHTAEPKMDTHKLHIISNMAVIGNDRWETTDKLNRVTFLVTRARELLKHKEKFDKLATRKLGDQYDPDLFSVTVNGITIRAFYVSDFSFEYDATTNIMPHLEIEFPDGLTLFEYIDRMSCLVEFFSFSMGAHMRPSDIGISRLSGEELRFAIKAEVHPPSNHAVHYVWPEAPIDHLDLWTGGSLVKAWDEEELAALKECVSLWFRRDSDWNGANAQMMYGLRFRRQFSADRLLAACKWFEEIPLTRWEAAISDAHIELIAQAAAQKGAELGYAAIKDRIIGSVKLIKTELNEDRLSRLLNLVKQKFGPDIVDHRFMTHLKRALELRGKAAHGYYSPADDSKFRALVKSICAMEGFCFLLTACDLPITSASIERARSNPFVRDYHRAYEV